MTRKATFAGRFYPEDKETLLVEIEKSFRSRFGPGRLPGKRETKKIYGCITPHAGYMFSGAGAARVFKEIAESEMPKTYIILGVNHTGPETCLSDEDWETPLGTVETDKELAERMVKKGFPKNNEAHHQEHSIEVQIPFLQYTARDQPEKLRVVCAMIADEEYEKWGKILISAIEETEKSVVIICSSDFTHYGSNYGYVPFGEDAKKNVEELDEGAIKYILKKDAPGFLEYTKKTEATICGKDGIATLLWIMNHMKKPKGKLLNYYTSGDVLGNYDNIVGYASIIFR